MNKGRKPSFEERIEIAQYTIANGLDYQKAIVKYDVILSVSVRVGSEIPSRQ